MRAFAPKHEHVPSAGLSADRWLIQRSYTMHLELPAESLSLTGIPPANLNRIAHHRIPSLLYPGKPPLHIPLPPQHSPPPTISKMHSRFTLLILLGLTLSLPLPLIILDALASGAANLLNGGGLLSSDPNRWAPANGTDGLLSRPQGAMNNTDQPLVTAVNAIANAIETGFGNIAVPADSLIAPFSDPIEGITGDINIKRRQDAGVTSAAGTATATATATATSSSTTSSVAEPTPSNVLQNIGGQILGGLQNLTVALAEPLNKVPADLANQVDDAIARVLPPATGLLADWHRKER
jgi:hypothetical protein